MFVLTDCLPAAAAAVSVAAVAYRARSPTRASTPMRPLHMEQPCRWVLGRRGGRGVGRVWVSLGVWGVVPVWMVVRQACVERVYMC